MKLNTKARRKKVLPVNDNTWTRETVERAAKAALSKAIRQLFQLGSSRVEEVVCNRFGVWFLSKPDSYRMQTERLFGDSYATRSFSAMSANDLVRLLNRGDVFDLALEATATDMFEFAESMRKKRHVYRPEPVALRKFIAMLNGASQGAST